MVLRQHRHILRMNDITIEQQWQLNWNSRQRTEADTAISLSLMLHYVIKLYVNC